MVIFGSVLITQCILCVLSEAVMEDGEGRDLIKLTTDKLSADAVSESVTCSSCGAISLFIGRIKNFMAVFIF